MNPIPNPLQRRDEVDQDPVISGSLRSSMDIIGADGRYDHTAFKMVAIVSSRLDAVIAANTVGHMMVALGAQAGVHILGKARKDADGLEHACLARYPLIILTARPGKIAAILEEARKLMWVIAVDYPEEGYSTTHDDDYGAALALKKGSNLTYIGAALFGQASAVKNLSGQLSLWRPKNGGEE